MSNEIQTTDKTLHLDISGVQDHYAHFNEFKKLICKKDIDYGKIPGTDKPTLLQPGAQKLAKAFRLNTALDKTDFQVDVSTGFVMYEYKCTVLNQNGEAIGQGIGSCNSFEDKYCFTGWRQEQAKPDAATEKAMIESGTGSFRKDFKTGAWMWNTRQKKRAQELIALQNTISKMAAKRAFVHAVLNSTGGGEFFTQDIEDMPEVVETGEKISELMQFVFWAIQKLTVGEQDVKNVWAQLPHLQKNADFIQAIRLRHSEFKDDATG